MNPDEQVRWYCLQLAANCSADDATTDSILADANKFVFFVRLAEGIRETPPQPQ